jgi:hypothetical protein
MFNPFRAFRHADEAPIIFNYVCSPLPPNSSGFSRIVAIVAIVRTSCLRMSGSSGQQTTGENHDTQETSAT